MGRIIEETAETALASGDVILTDNPSTGSHKIDKDNLAKSIVGNGDLTTSPTLTEYLPIFTNSALYKTLVSDVAKVIVEQYSGSSLAGSNQTIQAALNALNSKVLPTSGSGHSISTVLATEYVSFRIADAEKNFSQVVFYDDGRINIQRRSNDGTWLPGVTIREADS